MNPNTDFDTVKNTGTWNGVTYNDANKYLAAKGGAGMGGTSIGINDIGGSALDFAKGLNASSDSAFNDYLKASQSQQKPLDIYSDLETKAGLPQMRATASNLSGSVNDLEDTIRRIEPNVNATTSNSLVTEGQRSGMVNAQKLPFLQRLDTISTALGRTQSGIQNATADIGTKVGLAMQGQQQALDPYKTHMSQVSEDNARLQSGFSTDQQTKLQLLLTKLQREQTLSDREWQQASDLTKMQQEFNNQKVLQEQQLKSLGRYGIYNPMTGQTITNGAGSTGSAAPYNGISFKDGGAVFSDPNGYFAGL